MKLILSLSATLAFCVSTLVAAADAPVTIQVSSEDFLHEGRIAQANSAYGDNRSVAISWRNLPAGAEQLALICDDPDVPMFQPFTHWVVYNIPPTAPGIPAGMSADPQPGLPGLEGLTNGLSGIGQPGYFGPRPPLDGKLHRYHFRVYALDTALNLPAGLNKVQLLDAMEGHVLATGLLIGLYQRTQ